MESFLLLSFLFLIGGVIAVPIASRLGLGSVLGYLLAGIALSPILAALHVDVVSLQHFAEFGVVMMLFLVGLELEPRMLWRMKSKLLGLGGLQVLLTGLAVMGIAMALGQPWQFAAAIGMVLALSSTAIVLQTLNEKGLMRSDGGQGSFSVLLFQDIAVIPMLAFLPLLAMPELWETVGGHGGAGGGATEAHGFSINITEGMHGWQQALVTLGAIAFVVVGGTYMTRPIFRFIAMARLRELFTAAALLLMVAIALLMTVVGLSPALGTFLAGVVLANSEYRHELESDIDPFKGLLLGLFFITVGAGINFGLLFENLGTVVGLTLGLMVLKAVILMGLGYAFNIRGADKWLFALGLAQAGEFGFVLLSFTVNSGVLPAAIADQLLLVVALSMLLTPALFILYERVIVPRYVVSEEREADEINADAKIIVAGHGRFGGIVNRILLAAGHQTVVLDNAFDRLEMLRTFGFRVFYGDPTRPDLLHAAGIEEAKLIVVAIDGREQTNELVHYVAHNFPHVHITARALNRDHVYELWAAGCRDIIRETFDSSVRAGRSALEALGMHPHEAELRTRDFTDRDRQAMIALADLYDPDIPAHENEAYVTKARELIDEQEREMKEGGKAYGARADKGWMPPSLRDVEAEEAADAAEREA